MSKIKVALFGIYYPLAMLSYFRNAFERREDVELWCCGPFTGNWIPWMGGMTLSQKYVKMPDCPLPANSINTMPSPEYINSQMPWTPDLSLLVDAGWHLSGKPKGTVVALVKTDPHVLSHFYPLPKSYCDISFSMQSHYAEPRDYYLPYAYDPDIHYPMNLEKTTDVCMIGLQYPTRMMLAEHLRRMNVNVNITTGIVYDEYREAYNRSRIALTWSTLLDLPARTWEGMAMKLPVITNRVPDLGNFFVEGEHYLGFDTEVEAIKQVLKVLSDPTNASEMAHNAYRKVLNYHSYDARVTQILETAKLI